MAGRGHRVIGRGLEREFIVPFLVSGIIDAEVSC